MLDYRRTVVMDHSNNERGILDILRKNFEPCFLSAYSWDFVGRYCAASNLDRQISHL